MRPSLPAPLLVLLAAAAAGQEGERLSLEDLLRRAREEHAARAAALRPTIEAAVERLDALGPGVAAAALAKEAGELAALGPEACPLLVPWLVVADDAPPAVRTRASVVADALARMDTRAATEDLAALARTGATETRLRAVRVLAASPEPARATEVLAEVQRSDAPVAVRAAAAEALGSLGGPVAEEALAAALAAQERPVLAAVVGALAASVGDTARGRVLELARDVERARHVVKELVAYYLAHEGTVTADEIAALAALAGAEGLEPDHRLALVAALPDLGARLDSSLRKVLEPLASSDDEALRHETLVALARLGDKNARRDLLRPKDELVDRNPSWYGGYEQRAALLLRIGEPLEAARDLEKAVALLVEQGRMVAQIRPVRIELARAWTLADRLRNAHEALAAASLSRADVARLAADPDFRALREHSRYGKILQ